MLRSLPTQRRISRRGLVTTGLQVTLAGLALSACGGSPSVAAPPAGVASTSVAAPATSVSTATSTSLASSSTAASAAGSPAVTTLQFIGWDALTTLNLVQKFYQTEFTPSHDGIAVNVTSTAGGNFNDKITTLMAGGTPPDMMYVQDYMASSWVSKNVLTDLSPYANADKSGIVQQNWPNAIGFSSSAASYSGCPRTSPRWSSITTRTSLPPLASTRPAMPAGPGTTS